MCDLGTDPRGRLDRTTFAVHFLDRKVPSKIARKMSSDPGGSRIRVQQPGSLSAAAHSFFARERGLPVQVEGPYKKFLDRIEAVRTAVRPYSFLDSIEDRAYLGMCNFSHPASMLAHPPLVQRRMRYYWLLVILTFSVQFLCAVQKTR